VKFIIQRAENKKNRRAVIASEGIFSYEQLLDASVRVASSLLEGADDLKEKRVGFLIPPGFHSVAVHWGVWRAGGIAVPLSVFHARPDLEYAVRDSEATILVAHPDFEERLHPIADAQKTRFLQIQSMLNAKPGYLPEVDLSRRAMILYTSGTSGKPKGVVTTHRNIEAQVKSLIRAWEWTRDDRILSVLPLNHIHGFINVLTCALWAGATCEILPRFDAEQVWTRISERNLTLFMAVPTIYVKLIAAWKRASPERRKALSNACSKMRLMVSGSAALPVKVIEEWKNICGHVLLERYGMTEIGMALSNPLHGQRMPGYVGSPLPDVEVRLVDEEGKLVEPGTPGEIQVRGPGVFLEYWRRPDVTNEAFRDGWFSTGDTGVVENGVYRILGRSSVDIIKTGGYKVSALEIEEVLRTHPDIKECAVVGVEDPEWGERVSAALILKQGKDLSLASLRRWAKEQLASYKIPTQILVVDDLPRNVMGKVSKSDVAELFNDIPAIREKK
jgi:malonyl-CoA/methylmalonyl-CoA synthetase